MTDVRKVRPIAPLDAERDDDTTWFVSVRRYLTDAEFAAHFMPAELFDAVLDAARALERAYDEDAPFDWRSVERVIDAVRAYDAHRP
jgi:DNA-binding SARP family transcriptional activator